MRIAARCAVALALAGCDAPRASAVLVQVVDPLAGDPVAAIGPGMVEIEILQGDGERVQQSATTSAAGFDLALPIASYASSTQIQVRLHGEGGRLRIGALPRFYPAFAGFARVVVAPPFSCADLSAPRLAVGRIAPALVASDANVFLFGGAATTDPGALGNATVGVISAVHLTHEDAYAESAELAEIPPLRTTHASPLTPTSDTFVVVGSGGGGDAVLLYAPYDAPVATARSLGDVVHVGAGARSALVSLGGDGVAIVGGLDARGERVRGISWIDASENVLVTQLAVARAGAAAIQVGDGILVAGGQAAGEPYYEYVPRRGDGTALSDGADEVRDGAILVHDPRRSSAVLLGGRTPDGSAVRTDAVLVTRCPPCVVTPLGDALVWAEARLGPAVAETAEGTLLLGGTDATGTRLSAAVDRVLVVSEAAVVEAYPEGLPAGRAGAAAAHLGSGIVVLVGGIDASGQTARQITLCWPRTLEPLR